MKSTNIVWATWLASIVVSFTVLEGEALTSKRWHTFSYWNWRLTSDFPLWPVSYGLLFGGLAVHFFWTNQGLAKSYRTVKNLIVYEGGRQG